MLNKVVSFAQNHKGVKRNPCHGMKKTGLQANSFTASSINRAMGSRRGHLASATA